MKDSVQLWNIEFGRCKGCGLCVRVCPKHILRIQTDKRNENGHYTSECIDQKACIACKNCAIICPDCAIWIEDTDKKVIEPERK